MQNEASYFLELAAKFIFQKYAEKFENLCIVIPNKRGGLYFKKALSKEAKHAVWLPEILTSEEFVQRISGKKIGDELDLLLNCFQISQEVDFEMNHDFNQFLSWGPQAIGDFNDLDGNLADADNAFINLRNIKELEQWSLNAPNLTEFQIGYLKRMENLGKIHKKWVQENDRFSGVWQGLCYRIAYQNTVEKKIPLPFDKVVFCGLNALNNAEESIMAFLEKTGVAESLWDVDNYYMSDKNQEAGHFLRKRLKNKKEIHFVSDLLKSDHKQIKVVGVAGQMTQISVVIQVLERLKIQNNDLQKTVIVLADEGLLMPLLGGLPDHIESVNVTLQLPIKLSSLYDLYLNLLNTIKRNEGGLQENFFYFGDIQALLHNPFFQIAIGGNREAQQILERIIIGGSNSYLSATELISEFGDHKDLAILIFKNVGTPKSYFELLRHITLRIIENLEESKGKKIEYETALILYNKICALDQALHNFQNINLKSLLNLLKNGLGSLGIPLIGEPLEGLQIMGILETRTLDFDHIIMLSVNEGVIPKGKSDMSLLPNDLRRHLGLPLPGERDAIFAYHFYRLLQRAKTVDLIYNTETDRFGKGEKSRFISQILIEFPNYNSNLKIQEEIAFLPLINDPAFKVAVPNNGHVRAQFDKLLQEKGLSITALIAFNNCPLKFYFQFIAKLKRPIEMSEELEHSDLGNILHNCLEILYKPYLGLVLSDSDVEEIAGRVIQVSKQVFQAHFEKNTGIEKKLLPLHITQQYLGRLIQKEADRRRLDGNLSAWKISGLEVKLDSNIALQTGQIVKIYGIADRIETNFHIARILDYKLSVKNQEKFALTSVEQSYSDPQFDKAFQLLMYAWLFYKSNDAGVKEVQAYVIPFKAEKGLYGLKYGTKETALSAPEFNEIEQKLKERIQFMIHNTPVFEPTQDLKICKNCDFKRICVRH